MSYKYESFQSSGHLIEDIELVKKLEDAEKSRRIADVIGEQQRQTTAYLVSAMVEASLRPNWFQQGSSFVLDLLRVARKTGDDILLTASQAKAQVDELRLRGYETAQDVKHKLEVAGSRSLETAQGATHKSFETAQDVKHKLEVASENLSKKSVETAHKLQERLESAQDTVKHNIQYGAQKGLDTVQQVANRLKDVSLGLVDKVNQAWEKMTYNSNLTFVILEEETERAYRMASENQGFAIANAFKVAGLIKGLAPELYNPTSEPSSAFYAKMMEEVERTRRMKQDTFDRTALVNGAAVSRLIRQKFAAPAPIQTPAKAQFVEEIKVSKPLSATM